MSRLLLFAGTVEGRKIAEFCALKEIPTTVCVTTEYGANLLPCSPFLEIRTERLDEVQMEEGLASGVFSLIVDATHPYAALATENIDRAAQSRGIPCLRVLRAETGVEGCECFSATKDAAK